MKVKFNNLARSFTRQASKKQSSKKQTLNKFSAALLTLALLPVFSVELEAKGAYLDWKQERAAQRLTKIQSDPDNYSANQKRKAEERAASSAQAVQTYTAKKQSSHIEDLRKDTGIDIRKLSDQNTALESRFAALESQVDSKIAAANASLVSSDSFSTLQSQVSQLQSQNEDFDKRVQSVMSAANEHRKQSRSVDNQEFKAFALEALSGDNPEQKEVLINGMLSAYENLDILQDLNEYENDASRRKAALEVLSLKIDNSILGAYVGDRIRQSFESRDFCQQVKQFTAPNSSCSAVEKSLKFGSGFYNHKSVGESPAPNQGAGHAE